MNKSLTALLLAGPVIGIIAGVFIEREFLGIPSDNKETALEHSAKHMDPTYVCPMHADITSKEEGSCPICGMDLVPVKPASNQSAENDNEHPVVEVSPAVINSLGVRTVKLERKDISRRVETPGFVQQIKKGRMTFYKAPFDGVIAEMLYERGRWYDKAGEPLLALESEELLQAEQEHLRIYQNNKGETSLPEQTQSDEDNTPVRDDSKDAELMKSYFDEDNKLTAEYRDKLIAMGHNDESIAELEKEMLAMMEDFSADKTSSSNKEETEAKKPEQQNSDSASEKDMTLKQSRNRLRAMGLRDEDILQLERSGKPSNRLILYSNGDGRVMDMRFDKGYTVKKGERLFKFGGEVRAVVVANAFQRDAAWITTGQRVEVRMPHERGAVFPGIVNQGAVSINPDSQNIGIRLTFTAPLDKVRSNMYVVGTIFGDTRENVIAVPTQAIIRTEGEDRVIKALGDGRFQPVTVKVGAEAGAETEITEGLEEGDEVVIMAQFLIDSESSLQASLQRLNSRL